MKRKNLLAAAATLGMVAASLAGISSPASAALPATLTATADARVNQNSPNTTYGGGPALAIQSDGNRSWLRFNTEQIDDTIAVRSAKLQVFTAQTSTTKISVQAPDLDWNESTINWNNQPTQYADTVGTSSGSLTAGTWKTINLPTWVINKASDTNLTIRSNSADMVYMHSRENTNKPRLLLTYGSGNLIPETSISDMEGAGQAETAKFWFQSNAGVAWFQCKMEGPTYTTGWETCTSPQQYVDLLGYGTHKFQVRAINDDQVDLTPAVYTWERTDPNTPPPPPSGSTPPAVDAGWTRIVDDRFDSGSLPAHWRTYDGPYGSGPGNCATPENNFVENGSLVLLMDYKTAGDCGAGWYTGGMQIEKAKGAIDQTMTVRMRVVYTDDVNVRSHRNVPMRWVDDPNFQWMEGESDYCEGSSTTGCTTFLHYSPTNQQVSKSHTFDVTQWQVFKVVHQNNRVQIILNGNTIWDYQGTTTTVPDAIRRAVLQQECRSSCPPASEAGDTERIEIDYVTIDNES